MSAKLTLEFSGWCLMRIPTDPDPTDEVRGASGYTFAFAGEPDLDRLIRFQPSPEIPPRSHGPAIGVFVRGAARHDQIGAADIPALRNACVELLGKPKLENRNWTLTAAGYEPIVPFDLRISGDGVVIRRSAPLDPKQPDRPVWKMDEDTLKAFGANGTEYEPDTIGRATGIWDSLQVAQERLGLLERDLLVLEQKKNRTAQDRIAITALQGRIAELKIGIDKPTDRRIMARYYVERFHFPMLGEAEVEGDQRKMLGRLTTGIKNPWLISFWIGAWDPDALSAFVQGTLEIPYLK